MHLSRVQQIIAMSIVAIIIATIMRFLIYNYTGWVSFSMKKGENFQIFNIDPSLVSKIIFKKCIFKTSGVDGSTKTYDISYVLNNMIQAYDGNKSSKYIFKLDDPGLSPYSFQIPGFNDKDNHPDIENWGFELPNTKATLNGYYKLLK